ncbi:Alcohol dehydrogenase GroES domain protein [Rhodomicrobium vannielii ATCC 17100]|uniref:Alcohol dehydrogenase GroES domain protein n=1 Tax=Rhodomicrobium vannielii (strain ATCC 17100 / DSM 162 / LMG 4299 / NCIMB 10020 / ATH 3.1.1) TaxID=648757 RepID=E3I335_RHOVT|nr:NAD(P)-dependent alcohol dehydrogenase [Rhodomicrobium vannielii]ADP70329.1 Alcohol dehydrogenase GroES domain protein [Rhodomicrobium vannielii ATCC 17100]
MTGSEHDHGNCHGKCEMDRRTLLAGVAGLAAAPVLGGATLAAAEASDRPLGSVPFTARAYGARSATSGLAPITIERRAVGPRDVLIEILYAGICHSDIHHVREEWRKETYPLVPGHEIVGRIAAIGSEVTKFKVGDIGGVGCMVASCRVCENCIVDREQNCLNGVTLTYASSDKVSGGQTYGGYSERVVVDQHFVIRMPPGADLAAMTPLLCAGITTFSPLQHWKVEPGQRVGVVGLGGLGHVAVKLAVARRAQVTVFTTTPAKVADAQRLGAREAVLWSDAEAMRRVANQFDFIIATVPQAFNAKPFLDALKLDGTLVNVGALAPLEGVDSIAQIMGRKSLAGSQIGGIAETQEVIDFCAARNITADIEMIGVEDINRAYDRVVAKDVRYRFVIDMATLNGGKPARRG